MTDKERGMSEVKRDQLHAALMEAKATLDAERAELAKVRATCDMLGKERNEADEAKYHAELRLSALQGLVRVYFTEPDPHKWTAAYQTLKRMGRALPATPTERGQDEK